MSWTACKEHRATQPSTSRLPHYQHFTLIWQDQRHTGKSTWALSIMLETSELLSPLGNIFYTRHELLTYTQTAHLCTLVHLFISRGTEQFELASSKPICSENQNRRTGRSSALWGAACFHKSTARLHFISSLLDSPPAKGIQSLYVQHTSAFNVSDSSSLKR